MAPLIVAVLVAGCGGSSARQRCTGQIVPGQGDVNSKPCSAEASSTASTPAESQPTVDTDASGVATDNDGDRATITVGFGAAAPIQSQSAPALGACDQQLAALGTSAERSVAIPVAVSMAVDSSLGTDVLIRLSGTQAVTEGGAVATPNQQVLWAATYSDSGSTCKGPDDALGRGTVHWTADVAKPHAMQHWDAWMVLADAITPGDPDGADATSRIVISPSVQMGGGFASVDFAKSTSTHVVECLAPDSAAGTIPYLAPVPDGPLSAGCHGSPGAEAAATKAADLKCSREYPSGSSQTADGVTTYDRQASVFHVACSGFGAPDGVKYTLSMRCALIGAAAAYGHGPLASAAKICGGTDILESLAGGDWAGPAKGAACGFFSEVFAKGVATVVAGAAFETGPGAVALGVGTYRAFAAGLQLTCGGLIDHGAETLGTKFEAKQESKIAVAVVRRNQCLKFTNTTLRDTWSATPCPAT